MVTGIVNGDKDNIIERERRRIFKKNFHSAV